MSKMSASRRTIQIGEITPYRRRLKIRDDGQRVVQLVTGANKRITLHKKERLFNVSPTLNEIIQSRVTQPNYLHSLRLINAPEDPTLLKLCEMFLCIFFKIYLDKETLIHARAEAIQQAICALTHQKWSLLYGDRNSNFCGEFADSLNFIASRTNSTDLAISFILTEKALIITSDTQQPPPPPATFSSSAALEADYSPTSPAHNVYTGNTFDQRIAGMADIWRGPVNIPTEVGVIETGQSLLSTSFKEELTNKLNAILEKLNTTCSEIL